MLENGWSRAGHVDSMDKIDKIDIFDEIDDIDKFDNIVKSKTLIK